MRLFRVVCLLALECLGVSAAPYAGGSEHHPKAKVKNGTYSGVHSAIHHQDFFLGIPYAQPPVGELRFRNPRSLDSSWRSYRNATQYSAACVGYGTSQWGYETSEDCLYLNVIRPSGIVNEKLPVAVWIHGGGFVQGSGVDRRYNLSFIVDNSVRLGKPIIGVTLNYRLSAWGFLQSNALQADGQTNFGLRDQRLALHWIQENIEAFGGDPTKITIWGQSAGAGSVGLQLTAYNGRDDGLFRGAILESGSPTLGSHLNKSYEAQLANLTQQAGCSAAADSVGCLRNLSFERLNALINTTTFAGIWTPHIDGDIIERFPSEQLADGSFVRVPIIAGANTDEGTSFAPKGINNTEQFSSALLSANIPSFFAEQILQAYPENGTQSILTNLSPDFHFGPPYGTAYRRVAAYYGDSTIIAGRRLICETWSAANLTAYSYRFNAIPAWATAFDGATHFVEVAFAMLNLEGVGYAPVRTPPFQGLGKEFTELARTMSSDWVSFVTRGNPNALRKRQQSHLPAWPAYGVGSEARSFVYDANVTSSLEKDDFRKDAIALINNANRVVYER